MYAIRTLVSEKAAKNQGASLSYVQPARSLSSSTLLAQLPLPEWKPWTKKI